MRCLIPMREGGWDGDRTSLIIDRKPAGMQAQAVLDADIVVFHRPNDERCLKIADMLRSQGKKIVFENDDTYKHIDGVKLEEILGRLDGMIDKFIGQADMVTCSTEFLAEEYRKLNKNVVVLPNCVAPEDWPAQDEILRNEGEKVRIGFVGSVATNNDTQDFREQLLTLSKDPRVQLVCFGLPPKIESTLKAQEYYKPDYELWTGLNAEWQPFTPVSEYIDTLNNLKLDLMIIPRRDDYFNHCKSNLKFLEASMLEIPVIAQGFPDGKSPYQVDPEDAKHMTVIVNNQDWLPMIDKLVSNKGLRRTWGRIAREYVINKYSIENNIDKWIKAYESLL